MHIRFAEKKDIPTILRLLQQIGQVHHNGRPDLFRAEAQKYDAQDLELVLSDPERPIFVADQEGQVLGYGFCVVQIHQGDPVRMDGRNLYIDDLCVDAAARSQHIGTALYDHIVSFAREIGCRSVTLNVWAFNESALRFYEKRGLKPQKIVMESILEEN